MSPLALADDLTGAAEIAGIAWRFGLNATVALDLGAAISPDVFTVIDTDSRLCAAHEAARRVRETLDGRCVAPEAFFMKTDSVLRGNPGAEIAAAMNALKCTRALLLAGNPSANRFVRDDVLRVDGLPIDETDFARDPHHSAHTASATGLLDPGALGVTVRYAKPDAPLEGKGLFVGEVGGTEDLERWSRLLDRQTLLAGGGAALAAKLGMACPQRQCLHDDGPVDASLVVCGSGHANSVAWVRAARQRGVKVNYIEPLAGADAALVGALQAALRAGRRTVLAIAPGKGCVREASHDLPFRMARVVARVLEGVKVEHLLIEGGATARAILETLGCGALRVTSERAQGVVSASAENSALPSVTLKPGSYAWPGQLLPQ